MDVQTPQISFIEPNEEKEAAELIKKHLGFEPPRACGYKMVVKLYIRPEDVHQMKDDQGNPLLGADGKPMYIALPDSVTTNDKWRSCTALVVSQGTDCYKDERFARSGPWCRVGDWVIFPRNMGHQINYRGIPMQYINDDHIDGVVEDPSWVTRD